MYILLDIDGVMVPAAGWKAPPFLDDGFPAFSDKAINALNKLISNNTTIVLTTSHKSSYTIEEWKGIFKIRGIEINKLTRLPTNETNLNRKGEIINWFKLNDFGNEFIIVDDDKSLNSLPLI